MDLSTGWWQSAQGNDGYELWVEVKFTKHVTDWWLFVIAVIAVYFGMAVDMSM